VKPLVITENALVEGVCFVGEVLHDLSNSVLPDCLLSPSIEGSVAQGLAY